MQITRFRQRVSNKRNHWLEVENVVLSEEHKYIIALSPTHSGWMIL